MAAAVIGGVAIFGGSGTVWGAAIGGVLLVTINRALPILGIPDFWQRAVVGALIIGADRARPGAGRAQGTAAHGGEGRVMSAPVLTARRRRDLRRARASSWWRRRLLPRGRGHRAPGRRSTRIVNVANFDGPLTLYYLLLDTAPILLIALPMTLVIVTGEIDLSVASVVGLTSVLVGVLHQAGLRSRSPRCCLDGRWPPGR